MITLYGCAAMLALTAPADPSVGAAATPVTRALAGVPERPQRGADAAPSKSEARSKKERSRAKKKTKPPKKAAAKKTSRADTVLAKVQKYYHDIDDFQADFIQRYTKVALSRTSESRGKLMLKKPMYMRWAYEKPAEKLWIVDGETLYVSDPEYQQVFVDENFETEELQSSISFLWGRGKLEETFAASLGDPKKHEVEAGETALVLKPKRGATYSSLVLVVDSKTGRVKESVIHETAGNTNHFIFRNPKLNQGLDDALFQYTPPKGWEVIER